MSTVQSPKKVVIVGAGYAGLKAAARLARKTRHQPVDITVINGSDHFVERIRLHQLAANQSLKHINIWELLRGTGVHFVQGWVTEIVPEAKSLTFQSSDGTKQMAYDKLIYAAGSFIDSGVVPGGKEYALSLSTEATTLALREKLPNIAARSGRVLVIGGGLTGIESATELAEAYPGLHVTLVTRQAFGSELSKRGAAYLREGFARRGIEIVDNTSITRITAQAAEYEGGAIPFDVCLWAGAFGVPALAREAGLAVNKQGQVIVDEYLRSISHPDVMAVGDAASLEQALDIPIRMACATGVFMGAYVGSHLAAWASGAAPKPYQFGYNARCISLGRHDGLIQWVKSDDSPIERIITGRAGAQFKELICKQTLWQITAERWLPGGSGKSVNEAPTEPIRVQV
ncbi:MAG: FAD-dependent oxidoreductase [Chloroflexota bacterium]